MPPAEAYPSMGMPPALFIASATGNNELCKGYPLYNSLLSISEIPISVCTMYYMSHCGSHDQPCHDVAASYALVRNPSCGASCGTFLWPVGTSVQLVCKAQGNQEGITLFLSRLHPTLKWAVQSVRVDAYCGVL